MTTCSDCGLDKHRRDPDIGVVTYYCDRHGTHAQHATACADIVPIKTEGEIIDEKILTEFRRAFKPEKHDNAMLLVIGVAIGFSVIFFLLTPMMSVVALAMQQLSSTVVAMTSSSFLGTLFSLLFLLIMLFLVNQVMSRD